MKRTKFNGAELRDKGMKVAADHAELTSAGWNKMAFEMLADCPFSIFMAEEVRAWAYKNGLPEPPTGRAWGAVITKAAKAGLIVHRGYRNVSNPRAHATPASLWEKT